MTSEAPRSEADDEWLAEHQSNLLSRLRRRLGSLGMVADAVSNAETGPYAGAPRNPRLKADDGHKAYSTVRYSTNQIAYTTTSSNREGCRLCGEPLGEEHELECVRGDDTRVPLGMVRTCPDCRNNSWLLQSGMPSATHARDRAQRYVV